MNQKDKFGFGCACFNYFLISVSKSRTKNPNFTANKSNNFKQKNIVCAIESTFTKNSF